MPKPRVKIQDHITKNEPFEVKTLVSHKMESGQRKDPSTGKLIPRDILHKFVCKLDGAEVFSVAMHPAVSANPYLSFFVKAEKSGELEFTWYDDNGSIISTKRKFEVSG